MRRLLPAPASPVTNTMPPRPPTARVTRSANSSRSFARPTYGERSASASTRAAALVRHRDFVEAPRRVDALQLELAAIYELGARGAEHAVHGLRREDAAGRRDPLDALGDDHGLAVEVAAVLDHLARVQADAHDGPLRRVFAVAIVDRDLDLARTRHRAARRLERDHEAVAEPLHHDAAVAFDQLQGGLLDAHAGSRSPRSSPSCWFSWVDSTRSVNNTVTVPSGSGAPLQDHARGLTALAQHPTPADPDAHVVTVGRAIPSCCYGRCSIRVVVALSISVLPTA